MARKCPKGFICTDNTILWLVLVVLVLGAAGFMFMTTQQQQAAPQIYVVQAEQQNQQNQQNQQQIHLQQQVRPDLYPEPVQRYGAGSLPVLASRGPVGPIQQVGILTGEGGSASSAAPDRTILPLYGRELDPRRSRWNYYTRTDGANPVQVPVRYQNRICDDDTNGCNEVYNDESIHVPALGRSFKATIYRKTLF